MEIVLKQLKKMSICQLARWQQSRSPDSWEYLLANKEWDRRNAVQSRIWLFVSVLFSLVGVSVSDFGRVDKVAFIAVCLLGCFLCGRAFTSPPY